jgi:hypothetical protein
VGDSGFSVVMSDLQDAATTFDAESTKLRGLVPADGPACPDGGSGDIDAALRTVVTRIGTLSQSLAGAMAAHGHKLAHARARYASTELGLTKLSTDLLAVLAPDGARR